MLTQLQQPETGQRYDAETQRRVIELAARLQQTDHEHATSDQLEAAASEIGLAPEYVRQAAAMLDVERMRPVQATPALSRPVSLCTSPTRAEYRRFVRALLAPIALGTVAFALKDFTSLAVLFSLVLPAPLACLSGFQTGRKRFGFVAAALLAFALAPTVFHLGIHSFYQSQPDTAPYTDPYFKARAENIGQQAALVYVMLGVPLCGMLGTFGAWSRKKYLEAL